MREFRLAGVGILNGQLEDLVSDKTLLSTDGKLDLASLHKIRTRVTDGQSLSTFFELSDIGEFLSAVLDMNEGDRDLLTALQSIRKKG